MVPYMEKNKPSQKSHLLAIGGFSHIREGYLLRVIRYTVNKPIQRLSTSYIVILHPLLSVVSNTKGFAKSFPPSTVGVGRQPPNFTTASSYEIDKAHSLGAGSYACR